MKQYTIWEYMGFTRNGPPRSDMISLPEHAFDQLERFILSNRDANSGAEPLELMSLSARQGLGKVITAKNYAGVITTRDGTEIEILPKLTLAGDNSDKAVRKMFLTMLRTVQEAPFKTFRTAHLDTSRMRLLDLFVRMFLDEAHRLIRRGLKSDYTAKQDNETCVRGKIVFSEHIRKNLLHRERIFVEYDVFSVDCPENRLVKSTALYLQRHTTDLQNRKDLRVVLSVMEQVPMSQNVEQDFLRCGQSRTMADYQRLLELCRVFLQGKSFTAFSGGQAALALLFPMERIFESYVATVLRRCLDAKQYRVHVQAKGKYLFELPRKQFAALLFPMERIFESYVATVLRRCLDAKQYRVHVQAKGKYLFELPRKQFALRPDFVIEDLNSGEQTILDTKWKLLSPQWHNYGISQADMYQMYAYQKVE